MQQRNYNDNRDDLSWSSLEGRGPLFTTTKGYSRKLIKGSLKGGAGHLDWSSAGHQRDHLKGFSRTTPTTTTITATWTLRLHDPGHPASSPRGVWEGKENVAQTFTFHLRHWTAHLYIMANYALLHLLTSRGSSRAARHKNVTWSWGAAVPLSSRERVQDSGFSSIR